MRLKQALNENKFTKQYKGGDSSTTFYLSGDRQFKVSFPTEGFEVDMYGDEIAVIEKNKELILLENGEVIGVLNFMSDHYYLILNSSSLLTILLTKNIGFHKIF